MENRVKFKIGEIEFEAEGSAEVIEKERNVFMNALLPAAVDAIVRTRGVEGSTQYIENHEMPLIEQIDSPMKTDDNPNAINISSQDYSRTSLPAFINQFGNVNDQDFTLISVYYYEKRTTKQYLFHQKPLNNTMLRQEESHIQIIVVYLQNWSKKAILWMIPMLKRKPQNSIL